VTRQSLSGSTASVPITVRTPGTLSYHCEIHPSMVGALSTTR
jgi:plastocyanin